MPGNVYGFYPRSFAASSTSPTIAVGDQNFLAAATEQAPALPGASCSSGCLPTRSLLLRPPPSTPPYVTRSPPSLSLLHQPPKPPCPWPSAFVRAVIGLYGAAFMGTSTPLVACCPPAWVANSRVARTWLLIWDLQQASPGKTVSDNF